MNGVLEVDDGAISFDSTGYGKPVLFIHAGVADRRMWDAQFETIEGSHLIRYDMRGYGKSSLGSKRFTSRDDALVLLDHLGVGSAVVVGCSIGGNTALQLAEAAPDRIDGLILIATDSPGFDPGIDYESPEWPLAVEAFRAGDMHRVAELEAEMWLAGIGRSSSDLDQRMVDLFIEMDLIALGNETARDELDDSKPLENIPDIDAPVEVVVGSRDIPQLIVAAEHLSANLGAGAPVVIPETAHLPSMDRPQVVSGILTRFLAAF